METQFPKSVTSRQTLDTDTKLWYKRVFSTQWSTMAKRTWLEEFEQNPPKKFPVTIEYKGLQVTTSGQFETELEFQSGLTFANASLKLPQREAINKAKSYQDALVALWRQLDNSDFFDVWRRMAMTRKIRADRLALFRAQQKAEKDASRRERQKEVWQRIKKDASKLFAEIMAELEDHNKVDLGVIGAQAGKLGSLMTRLRYQAAKGMRDVA